MPTPTNPFGGLSRHAKTYTYEEFAKLVEWSLAGGEPDPDEQDLEGAVEERSLADWMQRLVYELEDVAHFEGGSLPAREPRPVAHKELHTDTGAYDEAIMRRLKNG